MCKTGALPLVICERLNTLKSLFGLLHGNCFCVFSDFVLPSAVVDLLCEETVHEQESVRSWAVKRQSSSNIKPFHSKVFKYFAFVLDTFCTKKELSVYEEKKNTNQSMRDRGRESKKII